MTQASHTQRRRTKPALRRAGRSRTLADRRADFEAQMRESIARDPDMAISDLQEVSKRIKHLRDRSGLKQYEVAAKIRVAPRTYQSWENGEVETERGNYAKIGKELGASANWILFGREDEPPLELPAEPRLREVADQVADLRAELLSEIAEVRSDLAELRRLGKRGERG